MRDGEVFRRDRRIAFIVGMLVFFAYIANLRAMGSGDTLPARYLPFSILLEGDLDLDEFTWLHSTSFTPYFLQLGPDGRSFSKYPIAAPLLATPLALPAVAWLRANSVEIDDVRFRLAAVFTERISAALIAALTVALIFLATREVASEGAALATTLAFAFSTNLWVTASQGLWQHGPAALGLAGAALCILRADTKRTAIAAGMFLALGIAARPTMALSAFFVLAYFVRYRPARLLWLAGPPLLVGIVVALFNLSVAGRVSGGYTAKNLGGPHLSWIAGLLFGPNRGLLVYAPICLLAIPGLVRGWRSPALPILALCFLGQLLLFGSFRIWWAGYTFGPRYLTDVLPAIAVCAAPAVDWLFHRHWGRALFGVLALWGVCVQVVGVYFDDDAWNGWPRSVDDFPERLWDTGDLHVRRAVASGFKGLEMGPILVQALTEPQPAYLRPLAQTDLDGEVRADRPPSRLSAGTWSHINLAVTNQGTKAWPAFRDYGYGQVGVLFQWWQGDRMRTDAGDLIPLPRNVPPGVMEMWTARIDTPREPGHYELALHIVQRTSEKEGTSWSEPFRVPIDVE